MIPNKKMKVTESNITDPGIRFYIFLCHKEAGLASHSQGSTHHFFINFPVPSQRYGKCYQIVRFYITWLLFLFALRCPCYSFVFVL